MPPCLIKNAASASHRVEKLLPRVLFEIAPKIVTDEIRDGLNVPIDQGTKMEHTPPPPLGFRAAGLPQAPSA
eukprot:1193217-Prorocentrum_minimum.AAC.4